MKSDKKKRFNCSLWNLLFKDEGKLPVLAKTEHPCSPPCLPVNATQSP